MQSNLFSFKTRRDYLPWVLMLVFVIAAIFALRYEGRVWWCGVGDYSVWSWDIWSSHNSQHVIDPYSFTHILHGILEFWLIGLVFRRMSFVWRLLLAIVIEGSWEIAENSSYIINRYREETISLEYFGDSVINSVSDILCCIAGFVIAYKLRFWRSLVLFVATEIVLIFWVRDSLIINLIMLIYPLSSIKAWQMAGQ